VVVVAVVAAVIVVAAVNNRSSRIVHSLFIYIHRLCSYVGVGCIYT
jgi:hypothetical protein